MPQPAAKKSTLAQPASAKPAAKKTAKPPAKQAAKKPAAKAAKPASLPAAKKAGGAATIAPIKARAPAVPSSQEASITKEEFAHVLQSLQKAKAKPSRLARLQGAVTSLLNGGKPTPEKVALAVQRLVDGRHVAVDAKGAVVFLPAAAAA